MKSILAGEWWLFNELGRQNDKWERGYIWVICMNCNLYEWMPMNANECKCMNAYICVLMVKRLYVCLCMSVCVCACVCVFVCQFDLSVCEVIWLSCNTYTHKDWRIPAYKHTYTYTHARARTQTHTNSYTEFVRIGAIFTLRGNLMQGKARPLMQIW